MTALLDEPPGREQVDFAPPSATETTSPRRVLRAAALPVGVAVVVALLAILTRLFASSTDNALDPSSTGPHGAHAVAQLLRDRGVDVTRASVPTGTDGGTTLLLLPELVSPATLHDLVGGSDRDIVVVGDLTDEQLRALRVPAHSVGDRERSTREPGCALPEAERAGRVEIGGVGYIMTSEGAAGCYAQRSAAPLVTASTGAVRVSVLGQADFFTNERLGNEGNAALALGLLGRHDHVAWVLPTADERVSEASDHRSLTDLLPDRLLLALGELVVAVFLVALWRARRLGPVVYEGLPVVVRSAESVVGRGRLYAAARARDTAATALRAGTRERLAHTFGIPPDAAPHELVAVLDGRVSSDATTRTTLLYGPAPVDDAALVRLAADLDTLEREVRRT